MLGSKPRTLHLTFKLLASLAHCPAGFQGFCVCPRFAGSVGCRLHLCLLCGFRAGAGALWLALETLPRLALRSPWPPSLCSVLGSQRPTPTDVLLHWTHPAQPQDLCTCLLSLFPLRLQSQKRVTSSGSPFPLDPPSSPVIWAQSPCGCSPGPRAWGVWRLIPPPHREAVLTAQLQSGTETLPQP